MNNYTQKELNELHAKNPQRGDYWSEHFCPVCVVFGYIAGIVIFCKDKISIDCKNWNWDFNKIQSMPIEDFSEWLAYKNIPGYWADVKPEYMINDVIEYENSHRPK